MDTILLIAGIVLLILGFIGTFFPALPGPPLAWAGLLCEYFMSYTTLSIPVLIITLIVTVAVVIIDTILPPLLTKKSGGTKAGSIGSTAGLLVGIFFFGIPGVILGPLIGAFVFEMINDSRNTDRAFKSAFASFLGFLSGTGIKMITVGIFIFIFVKYIH